MKCDSKEWRNVDYSRFDLVITNPPFKDVREMIRFFVANKVNFILIVSDVLRYSIKKGKTLFGVPLYLGKDAQHFIRPDGSEVPVHCGWIASIPDAWGENPKIFN